MLGTRTSPSARFAVFHVVQAKGSRFALIADEDVRAPSQGESTFRAKPLVGQQTAFANQLSRITRLQLAFNDLVSADGQARSYKHFVPTGLS